MAYVICLVPHEDFKRGGRRLVAVTRKIASLIASGYLEELPYPPALGFSGPNRVRPPGKRRA
jgi:hypothetical protein